METKLLTEHYSKDEFIGIKGYLSLGGYDVLKKAFKKKPQEIIGEVKNSGLRGRGGAGFPTGVKWGFLPKNDKPRYLICNADEGEPGTFKDRWMMDRAPHQLIEAMIISAYGIQSHKSYIYVRGEYFYSIKVLEKALQEAYDSGFLGKNILNSGFDHEMDIYSGAGAYICGEETGLISSLEGKKGQPKLKPPFPAIEGYLSSPTIVNNVETLAAVIPIIKDGAQAYRKHGTEKSPGTKLFSVSGDVVKPGNYEVSLGYPLKDLIYDLCGGLREGRKLKAVIPGGSSAPVLNADEALATTMDYEDLDQKGSMLGSGAVVVIDDSQCMVELLDVIMEFYHHESCGQCTPCREGTGWLHKISKSFLNGEAKTKDVALLVKVAENMKGRTICALSDAAAFPAISFVSKFRAEFERRVLTSSKAIEGNFML